MNEIVKDLFFLWNMMSVKCYKCYKFSTALEHFADLKNPLIIKIKYKTNFD